MTYISYPTAWDIVDEETHTMECRIEMQDEAVSTIEIKTPQSPDSWLALSGEIHKALVAMHGDSDG